MVDKSAVRVIRNALASIVSVQDCELARTADAEDNASSHARKKIEVQIEKDGRGVVSTMVTRLKYNIDLRLSPDLINQNTRIGAPYRAVVKVIHEVELSLLWVR